MIVSFTEATRYDIQKDCEVVLFMAHTNGGTFHTETPLGTTRQLREKRSSFKDKVIELIESGETRGEVVV